MLKKTGHIFLSSLILITGCTSTHHLICTGSILPEVDDHSVTIILDSGDKIYGRIIKTGMNLTKSVDSDSSNGILVSVTEIKQIEMIDHWQGALEGALWGLATGTFILALLVLGEPPKDEEAWSFVLLGEIIIGGGMASLGLIIGAIAGHKNRYIIESSAPDEYSILQGYPEKFHSEDLDNDIRQ